MGFWYSAAYLAGLGVLAHVVGERLPRCRFDPGRAPFSPFAWERNGRVYERLGIRFWKDKLPDMSRLDGKMQRKQLRAVRGREELELLLRETCVAESVHAALILLAPGLLLLWPGRGGVIFMLLDIFLFNLPFILIQRYNRPRLAALLDRRQSRERTKKHENTDPHLQHGRRA